MADMPLAGGDAVVAPTARKRVLDPVERVSEMLFGLFMALTFVGAISVAESGRAEIRDLLIAAIACNIAWGLVDGVMYLVRTITDRGRALTLVREVRASADAAAGRALIRGALSTGAAFVTDAEIEAMRGRMVALPTVPERPRFEKDDLLAALGVLLIVIVSTFPVVLPFLVFDDVAWAKGVSRAVALAMLFLGGLALGRHAGYGSWKVGLMMVGVGTVVVAAVMALGG
jgi:VIT1/CCC1 family predicted Fe2+/Mn2+ transporter